jgi:hypothetical protein
MKYNTILISLLLCLILYHIFNKNIVDLFNSKYIYIIQNNKFTKINLDNINEKLKIIEKPVVYIQGSVHGNEPAGTEACKILLNFYKFNKIKRGTVIIFPIPNPIGLLLNIRNNIISYNKDINRNFINNGLCKISQKIITIVKKSDFIIDLHEGWGFYLLNNNSIGSTLTPTSKIMKKYSHIIVNNINKYIKNDYKKFVVLNEDDCNIHSSLRCLSYNLKKKYLLVETTGQNNIQPLNIRVNQMISIVNNLLNILNIFNH